MRRAAIVAVIATAAVAAAPAAAEEVSATELAALAGAASVDPERLTALRAVTSVDNVPFDVDAVLAGADPSQAAARLRGLSRSAAERGDAPTPNADELRALAERLVGTADELAPEADSGGDGIRIGFGLPLPLALALALLAIAAGAVLAHRAARRRVLEAGHEPALGSRERDAGAAELERDAARAERDGDWEAAVRIRFQAGLLRLDEAGAIGLRPSLTAAGAARESRSSTLARLAGDYEWIVFGGRPAEQRDAEHHRAAWGSVLAEAGGRGER